MNKIKNIAQLIVKNFIGELTEDESKRLKLWFDNPSNVDLHERILNSVSFNRKREILKKSEQYKHEISAKINRRVKLRKLRFISGAIISLIFASFLIYAVILSNKIVEPNTKNSDLNILTIDEFENIGWRQDITLLPQVCRKL